MRNAILLDARLAVGLVAAWAGVPLHSAPPMSEPSALPPATPAAAVDVPSAPGAEPASLADIQRLASDFAQTLALYELAGRNDVAGIERLLDEADATDQPRMCAAATAILYERYADLNPAAALRHIVARGAAADRWLVSVFHGWSRSDLDAALRGFETLTANQRAVARAAILRARDDLPPQAGAELAARLSPLEVAAAGGAAAARAADMAADDPERAWRQALQRQGGMTHRNVLRHVVFQWARRDPLAALDAIESADQVGAQTRALLRVSAVTTWATSEPRAALDWATAQPESRSRRDLVGAALNGWANRDPRAAARWLSARRDLARYQHALGMVASSYAARHPDEAVEWALALPAGDGFSPVEAVFSTLAFTAPERAADRLARIKNAGARGAAEQALMHGWAAIDPDAAMAWLDEQAETGATRREALAATMLKAWAANDVASAMRHLDRLADPGTRDETVLFMLRAALFFDVALAESLFERLATEHARRNGADALHEHLAKIAPERAARYR